MDKELNPEEKILQSGIAEISALLQNLGAQTPASTATLEPPPAAKPKGKKSAPAKAKSTPESVAQPTPDPAPPPQPPTKPKSKGDTKQSKPAKPATGGKKSTGKKVAGDGELARLQALKPVTKKFYWLKHMGGDSGRHEFIEVPNAKAVKDPAFAGFDVYVFRDDDLGKFRVAEAMTGLPMSSASKRKEAIADAVGKIQRAGAEFLWEKIAKGARENGLSPRYGGSALADDESVTFEPPPKYEPASAPESQTAEPFGTGTIPGGDPLATPKYPIGTRVVDKTYPDRVRHGWVKNFHAIRMSSPFGGESWQSEYHYDIETDGGARRHARESDLDTEFNADLNFVPDPQLNGEFVEPETLWANLGSAARAVSTAKARVENARKDHTKQKRKTELRAAQERLRNVQAAWDAWADKFPESAASFERAKKPAPAAPSPASSPAPSAVSAGDDAAEAQRYSEIFANAGLNLRVDVDRTKRGKRAWNVVGDDTRTFKDALKAAGGSWYGPKLAWSFFDLAKLQRAADAILSDAQFHTPGSIQPPLAEDSSRDVPAVELPPLDPQPEPDADDTQSLPVAPREDDSAAKLADELADDDAAALADELADDDDPPAPDREKTRVLKISRPRASDGFAVPEEVWQTKHERPAPRPWSITLRTSETRTMLRIRDRIPGDLDTLKTRVAEYFSAAEVMGKLHQRSHGRYFYILGLAALGRIAQLDVDAVAPWMRFAESVRCDGCKPGESEPQPKLPKAKSKE